MHLVIGGTGLIGSAVCAQLAYRCIDFRWTTRIGGFGTIPLDLANLNFDAMPPTVDGALFLIAARTGYSPCEDDPASWRVNADAPIAITKHYVETSFPTPFPVFISSDVVEKSGCSAYQTQKRFAEAYMSTINGAIIRPARVDHEAVGELAKVIVDVGLARKPGVTRWP